MMILSTRRTETAASVACRSAHALADSESNMPTSVVDSVPSSSAYERFARVNFEEATERYRAHLNINTTRDVPFLVFDV